MCLRLHKFIIVFRMMPVVYKVLMKRQLNQSKLSVARFFFVLLAANEVFGSSLKIELIFSICWRISFQVYYELTQCSLFHFFPAKFLTFIDAEFTA